MAVAEITQRSELMQGRILAEFYAQWCGPCRAFAPEFTALEKRYGGKVAFARVDVDRAPELAQEFGVMSVPTLLLLENGAVQERVSGALPAEELLRRFRLKE